MTSTRALWIISCSSVPSVHSTWSRMTAFFLKRHYSVFSPIHSGSEDRISKSVLSILKEPRYFVSHPFCPSPSPSPPSLTSSRWLSRAINIALKKRQKKVSLPRTMRLIDEQGTNLGVMSSEIATKLADSKNLKLVEVQKLSPNSEAVYRLFTSKQQWEEAKKKKKAAKVDPMNTTKDITIFSQIGEHDLEVKLSHLREFLEQGHRARVFVQTKYRRGMSEERERERRGEIVRRIIAELEGLGEKVSEVPHQRRGVVCLFRPAKKKL